MIQLNYKVMGSGPALIILHGLFGSLDNWVSLGKRFGEHFSVFLIDQRNHGKSPHTDDWGYGIMAEDLKDFMDQQGIFQAHLLGHSMGGKTAMTFAQHYPDSIEKLIVADMGIKSYPPHHTEILATLREIRTEALESRQEAEAFMRNGIHEMAVRQFLLKNLGRKKEGGFEWKFNFPIIDHHYESILAALDDTYTVELDTLFVSGGKSDYVLTSDQEAIRTLFPQATFKEITQAGHWLHAEAPDAFFQIVSNFLLDEAI